MPFITFIYRIGNSKDVYYGKYVSDCISDDHEGLDLEVKGCLISGINRFREQKGLAKLKSKVHIGIMSFSSNRYIPVYSSDKEKNCFDFYCESNHSKINTYVNGRLLK
jgi:hypothetical protein